MQWFKSGTSRAFHSSFSSRCFIRGRAGEPDWCRPSSFACGHGCFSQCEFESDGGERRFPCQFLRGRSFCFARSSVADCFGVFLDSTAACRRRPGEPLVHTRGHRGRGGPGVSVQEGPELSFRIWTSGYGPVPKPKKPTTATLHASLQQVLPTLPALSSQIQQRGGVAKSLALPLAPPANPSPSLGAPAKAIPSPPKVGSKVSTLAAPQNAQPLDLQELEGDRPNPSYVAQVMIAQSTALTNLVAQLTGSSQDPVSDLQLSVPSGSRRAAGRAKLQSELALHKGVFFDSVVRSMSRRMSPTPSADRGHLDLLVPSEGAGNHSISDHDGDRLFDGRQSWSCKGQHSVDSGDARTSLLWTVGDSSALRY